MLVLRRLQHFKTRLIKVNQQDYFESCLDLLKIKVITLGLTPNNVGTQEKHPNRNASLICSTSPLD